MFLKYFSIDSNIVLAYLRISTDFSNKWSFCKSHFISDLKNATTCSVGMVFGGGNSLSKLILVLIVSAIAFLNALKSSVAGLHLRGLVRSFCTIIGNPAFFVSQIDILFAHLS